MYQVKHADKGRGGVSSTSGCIISEAYAERSRAGSSGRCCVSNAQVFHCFQPIFSARTGRVDAYEALMRSEPAQPLRSPADHHEAGAGAGSKLYEIERLITFTKATWRRL